MHVSDSQVCVFFYATLQFFWRGFVLTYGRKCRLTVWSVKELQWLKMLKIENTWQCTIFLFISSTHLWLKTYKHASSISKFPRHMWWHYNKLFANSSRVNRLWWVLSWSILWALCRYLTSLISPMLCRWGTTDDLGDFNHPLQSSRRAFCVPGFFFFACLFLLSWTISTTLILAQHHYGDPRLVCWSWTITIVLIPDCVSHIHIFIWPFKLSMTVTKNKFCNFTNWLLIRNELITTELTLHEKWISSI